jgi:hypothetical protein
MAEIKDKVVTVESLSTLHEHNKNTYMPMVDPVGNGEMTFNGDASFTGNMTVDSLMIGSSVRLIPTANSLEIVFLDEEAIDEG